MAKLKPEKGDNGKYGYVDENDNWVIEPKFYRPTNFEDGIANINIGDWQHPIIGLIKEDGSYLIEPKIFDFISDFSEGLAYVRKNSKFGYIKRDGSCLVEPKFDDADSFENGIAKVKLDGKYGYIKTDGNYLEEPKFDNADSFENGIAKVKLDGKYGYIKTDGNYLEEPKFDNADSFENGIARVKLDGKYGYIKTDGNYLEEPKFDDADSFENGIARVKLDGKYGYIKTDGNYLAEPRFDKAEDFRGGVALVMEDKNYKILLQDGTYKKMSKVEEYVLNCREIQNWGPGGWSFIEASQKDGKWIFDSWSRIMDNNYEWDDKRYDGIEDGEEVVRYYDEVDHNKEFADWANSLNLSTPEEVGELLWSNAQQLIEDAQIDQDAGGYSAPLRNLTLWIQLYNQLENIKNLGLMDLRKTLDLPEEDDLYLNPDKIKKKAVKMCSYLVSDEDGYEYLDFSELLETSRKPGEYNYISDYDFYIIEEDEEEWEEDEE